MPEQVGSNSLAQTTQFCKKLCIYTSVYMHNSLQITSFVLRSLGVGGNRYHVVPDEKRGIVFPFGKKTTLG